MRKKTATFGIAIVLAGAVARSGGASQQSTGHSPIPSFEVASVKPNRSNIPLSLPIVPGTRLHVVNVPLRQLIWRAYGVHARQLADAPGWTTESKYDIEARTTRPVSGEVMLAMLRTLLEDRFRLHVHREARVQSIYELVLRKPGGPDRRMRLVRTDCDAQAKRGAQFTGARQLSTEELAQPFCGTRFETDVSHRSVQVQYGARTMSEVARDLQNYADRLVVDRTDLLGRFDMSFEMSDEFMPGRRMVLPPDVATPGSSSAPSLRSALSEQLGLELVAQRAPVEVLVVDHVEAPSQD